MINILVSDKFVSAVNENQLQSTVLATLQNQSAPEDIDITVVIEDNDKLRDLNLQFLNIDSPTDVLSFAVNEIDPETGFTYLGDIIISYPKAKEQAMTAGHSIDAELQLLVVHGVLHLLGFNHDSDTSKSRMWEVQSFILKNLGVDINNILDE